jgi:hypothetical protein
MAVALPVFYSSVEDLKKNYVNSRQSSSLSYCVVFKNFTSSRQQNSAASDILMAKRMRTKAGLFEKLLFLKHSSKLINNPVE